jgi:hypothetical protein
MWEHFFSFQKTHAYCSKKCLRNINYIAIIFLLVWMKSEVHKTKISLILYTPIGTSRMRTIHNRKTLFSTSETYQWNFINSEIRRERKWNSKRWKSSRQRLTVLCVLTLREYKTQRLTRSIQVLTSCWAKYIFILLNLVFMKIEEFLKGFFGFRRKINSLNPKIFREIKWTNMTRWDSRSSNI